MNGMVPARSTIPSWSSNHARTERISWPRERVLLLAASLPATWKAVSGVTRQSERRPARRQASASPGQRSGLHPVVQLDNADDPSVALFRRPERQDAEMVKKLRKQLAETAANFLRLEVGQSEVSDELREPPCNVDVHYSWACLERLQQARAFGRSIAVSAILVPHTADEDQLQLAQQVAPVFMARSRELFMEFATGGSRKNFCYFAVAFPISKPLGVLKAPFVILENLESSHTIGQILRTAYHFGIDSVIVSRNCWERLDARACRVAVGWAYHMDFHMANDLTEVLHQLRPSNSLYLLEASSTRTVEPHFPLGAKNWGLVVGNEETGASAEVAALCGCKVRIPQRLPGTLNVAYAAAICLYELAGLSSVAGSGDPTKAPSQGEGNRKEGKRSRLH